MRELYLPDGRDTMARYWIFQANPKTGDNLRTDLQNPGWWRLTKFKDPRQHIHVGDGIVLWQVKGNKPEAAGVYAIGKITREPVRVHGTWQGWYRLSRVRDLERPIPPKVLRADPVLRRIPAFRRPMQGSNFEITDAQWQRIESYFENVATKAKSTPRLIPVNETARSAGTAIVPASAQREIQLRERALVKSYQSYMRRRGSAARAYRIPLSDGISITCDLYDKKRGNLIEAKSVVDRPSLRMAIGELADYAQFMPRGTQLAVLLPARPSADLEQLLRSQGMYTIWQSEPAKFADNSSKQRFV
jgi:predicted RNA-binding protein with PUA-like domain